MSSYRFNVDKERKLTMLRTVETTYYFDQNLGKEVVFTSLKKYEWIFKYFGKDERQCKIAMVKTLNSGISFSDAEEYVDKFYPIKEEISFEDKSEFKQVTYDSGNMNMDIFFSNYSAFTFKNVPLSIFEGFKHSLDKKDFYFRYILNTYKCKFKIVR